MTKQKLNDNQSGLASLVIAILVVIVLTTIVLGFLQIIRREQRRSLDRQLSNQAYYAAESGINDATIAINEQGFTLNKTHCGPLGSGSYSFSAAGSNKLTSNGNVQYSCLLINQTPSSITKTLDTNVAKTFPIDGGAGGVSTLTFKWVDAQTAVPLTTTRPAGSSDFPPSIGGGSPWNSVGLIHLDLVPVSLINAPAFETNTRSVFLYPNTGGGGLDNFGTLSNGAILHANCAAGTCSETITGLSGNYYARVVGYYRKSTLDIVGTNGIGPITAFQNGQILVDSTGKAGDVTRRIQELIDPKETILPDFGLASMDSLCKQFTIIPNPTDSVSDSAVSVVEPACAFNP